MAASATASFDRSDGGFDGASDVRPGGTGKGDGIGLRISILEPG